MPGERMVDETTRARALQFVRERTAEQLRFVMDLAHENSYSYNKAGTDRVAEMVLEKLGSLFPFHRIVEHGEVGDTHILGTAGDGKSIYLLGHMDTVFPPDHPFRDCHVEGDRLHGPGCGDMKAGIATIVYAVLGLAHAGALSRIPLKVVLGGDEEIGAVFSRPVYEEERTRALACLVVEGAGKNREIVVSRNGKIGARVDCVGRDQHVGTRDLQKASAVLELAHKVMGLEALNGVFPGVRVNVGKVEGGLGPATIPASARALVDIRWEDQSVRDGLLERIRDAVGRPEVPGCHSELTLLNERNAWPWTEGTQRLADLIKGLSAELGHPIDQEHRLGTSDSNFFGCAGVPTVDGLGPICEGYHTANEFVYVSSIPERTALLAASLLAMAREMA